eukprot:3364143-Karenia_brevis.AAC.1
MLITCPPRMLERSNPRKHARTPLIEALLSIAFHCSPLLFDTRLSSWFACSIEGKKDRASGNQRPVSAIVMVRSSSVRESATYSNSTANVRSQQQNGHRGKQRPIDFRRAPTSPASSTTRSPDACARAPGGISQHLESPSSQEAKSSGKQWKAVLRPVARLCLLRTFCS